MSPAPELAKAKETIARLREDLSVKDALIARLQTELAEAQENTPWLSDACGDDLWDL